MTMTTSEFPRLGGVREDWAAAELPRGPKPNVYAALIVKNEARVIARTIAAVAPYVRGVVIVDTGSSDDTMTVAGDACVAHGLDWHPFERVWLDYATNRTELLSLARVASCGEGYTWMLDADEIAAGRLPENITAADAWHIARVLDNHEVWGVRIFSNAKPWRYVGAVHETPDCPGAIVGKTRTCWVENRNDGAQGTQDPAAIAERYSRDAHHFANMCQANPGDTRSAYYLAQSLRDAGRHAEAFAAYQRRAMMREGFQEEQYMAQLMVARYLRAWGNPVDEVVRAFLAAVEIRPTRAEAMVECAGYVNDYARKVWDMPHWERLEDNWGDPAHLALLALSFAHRAKCLPPTEDLFLVHRPSQTWLPLYEIARAMDLLGWQEAAAQTAAFALGTDWHIGETERATLERIARSHDSSPR